MLGHVEACYCLWSTRAVVTLVAQSQYMVLALSCLFQHIYSYGDAEANNPCAVHGTGTTCKIKKWFLYFKLCPLHLVLSLVPLKRCWLCLLYSFLIKYLYTWIRSPKPCLLQAVQSQLQKDAPVP